MRLDQWFGLDPAEVLDLHGDRAIPKLVNRYCGMQRSATETHQNPREVLLSVLTNAWDVGARTVVIERRYPDVDYKSEHSLFYSQTFRNYPAVTHRLHFFLETPPEDVTSKDRVASFDGMTYLGYTVLRPVPGAAVGRTMIAPNPKIASDRDLQGRLFNAVTCVATDTVNLFGCTYTVTATPFMAQDNQLGVCAHATAWMAAYFHRLRYNAPRHLPGDIAMAVPTSLIRSGPALPSTGLTVEQLCEVLRTLRLPPLVYRRGDSTLAGQPFDVIARRYLDSCIPVIVATATHTFLLVGYINEPGNRTTFICQDDEVGPYQTRMMPHSRRSADQWLFLVVPLPPDRLYVPAERAEAVAETRLADDIAKGASLSGYSSQPEECEHLRKALSARRSPLKFVTSAARAREFKRTLIALRGYPEALGREYMRIPMPKWVWVTELVDRERFEMGKPCVVAEALIDSTDHSRDTHVLAWRIPGRLFHWVADQDRVGSIPIDGDLPMARSICASASERDLERG